ncbi:hypothetical protein GGS20DRAFT_545858 [Poronia punctata]|nr:hypothetical protein GGS20DRAFT_545858 [Poronia punctata]
MSLPLYIASRQRNVTVAIASQSAHSCLSLLRPINNTKTTRSLSTSTPSKQKRRQISTVPTANNWTTTRRHYSGAVPVAVPVTAEQAAANLLSRFKGETSVSRQTLDANQLCKLHLTLGKRRRGEKKKQQQHQQPVVKIGTEVPRGHHLVYFTPTDVESELGNDGSDASFNAPWPFTRRMWAGGRMRWCGGAAQNAEACVALKVGDEVEERTRLVDAVPKRSRDGGQMVLVNVEKEFWGPRGLALVDERSWIFRPEATGSSPAAEKALRDAVIRGPSTMEDIPQDGGAYPKRQLRWSPTGLFRFSALTFNGHKIHYDPTWSTAVEGHPACVVHGPLNLINMLDYWQDHCAAGGKVREISYRAVAPIYAGETYAISAKSMETDGRWEVLVEKDGKTCMRGEIVGV